MSWDFLKYIKEEYGRRLEVRLTKNYGFSTTSRLLYRPRYGNYQHWGLYLEDEREPLIFEVTGEHPKFKRNIVKARPENSRSFLQKVYIGVIRKADVKNVKQAAETVPVDNETVEWDCQDYVLDVLDNLEEEFILDCDDEDYRDAREILREKMGAIL